MKHQVKKTIYNIAAGAVVLGGIIWIGAKFVHLGNVAYTENAQVKQLIVPVNARVPGFIKEISFAEYQPVKKGDTLVILEDEEYRLRVAQAEADYQNTITGKQAANQVINTTANNISVVDAGLAELKALLDNANTEYKRYKNLLAQESVTQQEFDGVNTKHIALKAKYETLVRQKQTTVLVKDEQNVRLSQNDAAIEVAKAALDLAKLNLSYAVITAPADGFMGRKNIQIGQLIQPGQTLVDLVDDNEKWVTANYKETQTHNIKEGQVVDLSIDGLPNVILKGVVKSISNATGSSFSVVPQDNSAGNFVKIEQRIPVRIEFSKENDRTYLQKIRAGMNVEVKVRY